MPGTVIALSSSERHTFHKHNRDEITLVAGLGVQGDAHAGETVKHRSRVQADPSQPNLRQVHLIHAELFDELQSQGFVVKPGELGENITTRGIDLLTLPAGTLLRLGGSATVEVTGLRNPCKQIDDFQSGLMRAVLGRDDQGNLIRKTGVMAIVQFGGPVRRDDPVIVTLPPLPHKPLESV